MVNNHGCIVTTIISWSSVTLWQPWSTMVNHGPTSHCDKDYLNMKINHGQQWSTTVQCRIVKNIVSIWKSIIVNHGPTSPLWQILSTYENQAWSTIVNHVFFGVYYIYIKVYMPWVYHINILALILFPLVFSINLLGLLVHWVYNINCLGLLICKFIFLGYKVINKVYNINHMVSLHIFININL